MDNKRILLVVTGTARFANENLKTGLWLSEFTHIYHRANRRGFEITVANPGGGVTPVDPESLKPVFLDKLSGNYWKNPAFRNMLQHAKSLNEVVEQQFDCIYLAGGHGAMYDFPDNSVLQMIIKRQYESNRVVAAICHGVCGLINVKLSGGGYLVQGKKVTGFSWFEEILARRKKAVPFNLEAVLKARGALYRKSFIPFMSKVIIDGNLITGQDPFSSTEMAKTVVEHLEKMQ